MSGRQIAGKAVRMLGKGMNDVARSMSTPTTDRRPKISQLPRKSDAGIVSKINLEVTKTPGLRGRDISGRKENKKRG